jgi:hypothetical protein
MVLLCWCTNAFAQQSAWEPIPADGRDLKDDPAAPGASALILFREILADDKKGVMTEHVRIKILRDEGKKYADFEIPTSKIFKVESKDIKARTVRPDGSSLLFTGEIHDKTVVKTRNVSVIEKTFTLPDVQTGGIVEVRYRARYQKNEFPTHTWDTQFELFTRKAQLRGPRGLHLWLPWAQRRGQDNHHQDPDEHLCGVLGLGHGVGPGLAPPQPHASATDRLRLREPGDPGMDVR